MCFSAAASFSSGIALSGVGTAALIKNKEKRSIPLASIPLFFGIQQLFEGFVWSSLATSQCHQVAVYGFLAFALVFWPFYSPLAFFLAEKNIVRKKILLGLFALGTIVSIYFLGIMLTQPISSEVTKNSIQYILDAPLVVFFTLIYFIATCASAILSSHKRLTVFGIFLTISLAIALYFYFITFTSVWCFFAAILSLIIFSHINESSKKI
ncbi:MAG: hypothetical protein NTZ25_04855 [Candidatus Peregrinibacteria bacterium]|nr:hypothetical protein [Candidatus Peregrinibacteria bacterium]